MINIRNKGANNLFCLISTKYKFYQSNTKKATWNDEDVKEFIVKLKTNLNLKTSEDWNLITTKIILSQGGSGLLNRFSVQEIKSLGCPEGKLKFIHDPKRKSIGYWDKQENILNYINKLKEKLNINNIDDWNKITAKQIKLNGGSRLLHKYSMYKIKCLGYPEGKLIFKKRNNKKMLGYWDKPENIQKFLSELKEKLNLQTPEDWNSITRDQIKSLGGISLLNQYTMNEIKIFGCPEGKLKFLENKSNSPGFWEKKENILNFLNELKEKYNLNTLNDWNNITAKQIKVNGGSRLLNKYSMYDLKCFGCPDGKDFFDIPNKPTGFWNDDKNIQDFIDKIKLKFNVKSSDDWNRISKTQIRSIGGHGIVEKLKFSDTLRISNRSSQRWLFLQIQKLFPGEEIVEDYFHSEISRKTGYNVQFDIYLVDRNIAIEYHGKQHYEDIPSSFASLEVYKFRDKEKETLCNEFGIQLIVIPYWWDNKIDSLQRTISEKIK